MSRDVELFLRDMREAAGRVVEFTEGMASSTFERDARTISAVERQLFILGEAAKQVSTEVRHRWPELDWRSRRPLLVGLVQFAHD